MQGKDFINDLITTYFTLVTLITAVMYVLGIYYIPNASFGYEGFAAPLIYAAYGTLPNIVMFSKKELSVKEFLIRKAIQFILIEVIVLAVALPGTATSPYNVEIAIALAISVFVIFILSHLFDWFQNSMSARRMTEDLLAFQRNHK